MDGVFAFPTQRPGFFIAFAEESILALLFIV